MEIFSKKLAGINLLLGSLMAVLTMVLHPIGGDVQQMVKIREMLIFSHSLAIACVPLIAFGLWGVSSLLATPNRLAMLAFFIAMLGLGSAALAGTINGLVLPKFVAHFADGKVELGMLNAILDYARSFNGALAYIFMVSITVAILIWSILMVGRGAPMKWLGYYGQLVVVFGIVALMLKSNMTSVHLFGVFIFGMASWLILAAVVMINTELKEK
ncbi:hypothetical protein [Pedobacter sp.]